MVDLNKIANKLKKEFGSSGVASSIPDPSDYVSTGNLAFDLMSDGGAVFGYCIEFLGLSASGKSLFIQQIIANAQKEYGAVAALVDRENAYTKKRGEQIGIDNDNLLVVKPLDVPTVLDGFQFLSQTVRSIREKDEDAYIVLAMDSIASFDKDTTLDKGDAGRKAKATHEGLRHILRHMDDKVMLLIANQVTYKIGVMYGDPRTTTAGESLKYYSTIRFALEDRKKIVDPKKNDEVVGNWLGIEVIKTRLGPAHRSCYLRHFYETGIDFYSGYGRLLANRNYLIPKNKQEFNTFKQSTLKYKDVELNEHKMEEVLEKYPELLFSKYPEFKE